MLIAYDGTHFGGWQRQPNTLSIQELIEKALTTVLRCKTAIVGSGRTDQGVHALEQVAHFSTPNPLVPGQLRLSLNALLPSAIRITEILQVSPSFHARYSAKGKIYRYHLFLGPVISPFRRPYALHLSYQIDKKLLHQAATYFVGKHDFTSFSNEAHKGSASKNAIRTLHRVDCFEEGEELILELEGEGFLYKMVRNIVGTLIDVARGKLPIEEIPKIFAAKDRRLASAAAPAHGLFLVKVLYDEKSCSKEGECNTPESTSSPFI
jgi:tRNA pseudouridine38-40 synthase